MIIRIVVCAAVLTAGPLWLVGEAASQTHEQNMERALRHQDDFRKALEEQHQKLLQQAEESRRKAEYYEELAKKQRAEEDAKKQAGGAAGAPQQRSGASGASGPTAKGGAVARKPWTGDDCTTAGELDRNTAAWYTQCMPRTPARRASSYRPRLAPEALVQQAKAMCGNVPGEAVRRCIDDNKLKILLRDEPDVRTKCASLPTGKNQIACVDLTYVYGPTGPTPEERREILRFYHGGTAASSDSANARTSRPVANATSRDGCAPGFGMKPTPGAFGGWSCQKLGVIFLAPNRRTSASGSAEEIEATRAFEQEVDEVAAAATVSAGKSVRLAAADRQTCLRASFEATRSVLKGGAAQVPAKCRAAANASRAELLHYARVRVAPLNPGMEELLNQYGLE